MGFSHWPWIHRLSQLNWFGLHLYWGRGNNLESILLINPVADLYLSFRLQECRPPSPQDAGMIVLSMGDGILTHLP
jgi:DMSO/TMAO reductase YedYZ heme-binding membrane subunit